MLQFCNSLYLVLLKITECADHTHADILCLVMMQTDSTDYDREYLRR